MSESLEKKPFGFFNAGALKIIACVTMLMDHIGYCYYYTFEYAELFRTIGRMSYPLFAFLIATGYNYTKNINRYLLRLFLFAIITEPFFDRAFMGTWYDMGYQNALYTLFLGLFAIYMLDTVRKGGSRLLCIVPVFLCMLCAEYYKTDYGYWGVLMIVLFYLFQGRKWWQLLGTACVLLLYWRWPFIGYRVTAWWKESGPSLSYASIPVLRTILQGSAPTAWQQTKGWSLLALVPIFLYNGRSGMPKNPKVKKALQYFFYAFYPLHLMILALLNMWG